MDHIEIRRVNYEYAANERAVTALRDVSFGVAESEFICVVGRSGCGKTTLLNILAGFMMPTTGEVLIGGRARGQRARARPRRRLPGLCAALSLADGPAQRGVRARDEGRAPRGTR